MKRLWPLVALGIGAYVVFVLATLPASVVLNRLGSLGVNAAAVSGTIWNGSAEVLEVQGMTVGKASWRLRVLPLFTGRLSADVRLNGSDGSAQGRVTIAPGGRLALDQFNASLPIGSLPAN